VDRVRHKTVAIGVEKYLCMSAFLYEAAEPPPTKVEGFSVFERLRRTVEVFSD